MRYALVPHANDWKEARVYRDGLEFNHPLLARVAAPHPGPLPARWNLSPKADGLTPVAADQNDPAQQFRIQHGEPDQKQHAA